MGGKLPAGLSVPHPGPVLLSTAPQCMGHVRRGWEHVVSSASSLQPVTGLGSIKDLRPLAELTADQEEHYLSPRLAWHLRRREL